MTTEHLPRLYFAYGSNLNRSQMRLRCPAARPVALAKLHGFRLMFKGVADVIPERGTSVPGVVWELTERCLSALDRYEGFPTLYDRHLVTASLIDERGREVLDEPVMTYRMTGPAERDVRLPSVGYYNSIATGYGDFGLDMGPLETAVRWTRAKVYAERDERDDRPLRLPLDSRFMLPGWADV